MYCKACANPAIPQHCRTVDQAAAARKTMTRCLLHAGYTPPALPDPLLSSDAMQGYGGGSPQVQHLPSTTGPFIYAVNTAPEHTSADSDHSEWIQSGNADGASYIEGAGNGERQCIDNSEVSANIPPCMIAA